MQFCYFVLSIILFFNNYRSLVNLKKLVIYVIHSKTLIKSEQILVCETIR